MALNSKVWVIKDQAISVNHHRTVIKKITSSMKVTNRVHLVPSKQKLHALSQDRIELSEELFHFIAETLNKLHGTDYSIRFWKIISEEYTRSVINRYDLFREKPIEFAPPFVPLMAGSPGNRGMRLRKSLAGIVNYFRTLGNRRQFFELLLSGDQFLVGFDGIPAVAEETGGVSLPDCSLKPAIDGDRKKRALLNRMAEAEPDLFKQNVLRQLPGFLVEHFGSIYKSIELHRPEKKTFHIRGNFSFSYRQIVLAKYAESGSKLIWYQNGAMVGECRFKYGGYLVRSVADEHRTWGWKLNGVDRPWKAYDLQQFRRRYEQSEKGNRDDLLITYPKLRGLKSFYLEITQNLLDSLDPELYRSIRIRPYPSKKDKRAAAFQGITDRRVTVSTFDESMAEEVAKSRIVLHMDVPATSFLESISVDHPSMGLLLNEYPTDIVIPYYEFFMEKGVLHRRIESVAGHLNSCEPNLWWNGVNKSGEYAGYKNRFTGE